MYSRKSCAFLCFLFIIEIYFIYGIAKVSAYNLPKKRKLYNFVEHQSADEKDENVGLGVQMTWLQQLKLLRNGIKKCEMELKVNVSRTWSCFKITSLSLFDDIIEEITIPLWYGISFVRNDKVLNKSEMASQRNKSRHLSAEHRHANKIFINMNISKELVQKTWLDCLSERLNRLLVSHALKINIKDFTETYIKILEKSKQSNMQQNDSIGTGRLRRHRLNMMMTMMFGVTALGSILVPMGFQLLSVVSGKALLLAKMALLLASINGLKRVANSGVHYGLYQVPGEHYGGYYDRGDAHHPRTVPQLQTTHGFGHLLEQRKL